MQFNSGTLFDLVNKYNITGPRYTSYPTAVQFTEEVNPGVIDQYFKRRAQKVQPLSLYFHIPFCFSHCWYCGCTKIITRNQDRGDIYLDYLEKEIILVRQTIRPESPVKQIHFGGGTPTFLNPDQLHKLGDLIHSNFSLHDDVEFSAEIDPRRCSEGHIKALRNIGGNRASLGVQDMNPAVQEAIHRIQPFEQTRTVTESLRNQGIKNINFDLIYGLPKQTLQTFNQTIDDVVSLNPDRFAIYSYAHLPSLMPAQKLLNEDEFPSIREKLAMLMTAIDRLPELGYRFIGMDHFARENDELSLALDNGSLQRNFQGYSTHAELEMIALGMSGISQGDRLYYQNEKDLGRYYGMLDEGKLPIKKVLPLTEEDKIRRKVIMQIMCRASISFDQFKTETGLDFKTHFQAELASLEPLEVDGLLHMLDNQLIITERGRLFVRNIAMAFDAYLVSANKKPAYSKTV